MPLGDLEDVRSFGKEDYSVRDFRNLLKLQKKYGTSAILLVNAEYIPTEKAVNLTVEKIKNSESESFDYQIIAKSSESESELFALAANHLLKRIAANNFDEAFNPNAAEEEKLKDAPLTMQKTDEQTFRRASPAILEKRTQTPSGTTEFKPDNNLEEDAEPAEITPAQDPNELLMTDVFVMANDLVSWGRMRQKITNTALIKNIRIKSFTAGKAFVTLTHNGEFVEVIAKLEESGMEISKPSKYWEIREKKQ